jgi:hypothetical protein
MADKPAPAKPPDLMPVLFILLIIIIAGLGSIRWRGLDYYYQEPPPSNRGGIYDPPFTSPDLGVSAELNCYTILAGRFDSYEKACVLAAELREKRVNNFLVQAGGRWLVCVGKYLSHDRAKQMLEILKNHGVENARILRPKTK